MATTKALDEDGVVLLASDIKTLSDATYPSNAAIASAYDSTAAYSVGDYCLRNGLLYKCNTAIGTGGETWTAAHWTQTKVSDEFGAVGGIGGINENLLDNWYFVGGGSQINDGVFPINSRGLTSYTSGDNIDKWTCDNAVSLSSGYITIGTGFYPQLGNGIINNVLGKTITLSVLYANGTLLTGSDTVPSQYPSSTTVYPVATGLGYALYDSGGGQLIRIDTGGNIIAVKAELGDTQTLAHQENGVWVLNELPNFDEQLMRCRASEAIRNNISAEARKLQYTDVVVQTSAFLSDSTYSEFPFRAAVALTGTTSSLYPEVTFNSNDAISGIFSPIVQTYNGGVYIYASEVPDNAVTIPSIICWTRGVTPGSAGSLNIADEIQSINDDLDALSAFSEQNATVTVSGTGDFTIHFEKLGKLVNASVHIYTNAAIAVGVYTVENAIPQTYRPRSSTLVSNADLYPSGVLMRIDSGQQGTGIITFYPNGTFRYSVDVTGVSGVNMMAHLSYFTA